MSFEIRSRPPPPSKSQNTPYRRESRQRLAPSHERIVEYLPRPASAILHLWRGSHRLLSSICVLCIHCEMKLQSGMAEMESRRSGRSGSLASRVSMTTSKIEKVKCDRLSLTDGRPNGPTTTIKVVWLLRLSFVVLQTHAISCLHPYFITPFTRTATRTHWKSLIHPYDIRFLVRLFATLSDTFGHNLCPCRSWKNDFGG